MKEFHVVVVVVVAFVVAQFWKLWLMMDAF